MTRPMKASDPSGRAVNVASLVVLDQPGELCTVCNIKPSAAAGRLSRCLDCLRADVDLERQQARRAKGESEGA
jgi:hypothetical protein